MSCGTGVLAQLVSTTQIDEVVTGNGNPEITFFRSSSTPYSAFATDWQRINFATTSPGTDVVETTADLTRSGDMLCHMYLVIKAPALFNVSSDTCDISGSATNTALATKYGTDVTVKKRAYVGSARSDVKSHGRLLTSGTSAASTDAQTFITTGTDVDLTSTVYPGCRIELYDFIANVPYTDGDPAATAASYAELHATVASVEYASSASHISWHEPAVQVGDGLTYSYKIYAQDDAGTLKPDMDASVVSTKAPGVTATNTLTAGPSRGGVNNSIASREPIMDNSNFAAHYGTYAPVQMIKSIAIQIGTNTISSLTATVIQAHIECWSASDRIMRRACNASRDTEELCAWALQPQVWYVPIPFWFGASGGYQASLPLVALSFHTITFALAMQAYTRAIVNGCGGDMTDRTITMGAAFGGGTARTLVTHSGPKLTVSSLSGLGDAASAPTFASTTAVAAANFTFFLLAEYVYLSDEERDIYSDMNEESLITQWQYATDQILSTDDAKEVQMRFNHPVQCILFAGRLQSNINDHRWGEYEGPTDPLSVSDGRPNGCKNYWLKEAQVKFNNNPRTCVHGPEFYHQMVPSLAADRVPDSHFFIYSFALASPTSSQASGSANFSRLDVATLTVTPHGHLFADQSNFGGLNGATKSAGVGTMATGQQVYVEIAASNLNVFRYENGLGGPGYV